FLKYSIAGVAGLAFSSQFPQNHRAQGTGTLLSPTNLRVDHPIPPLFCTAYIDPGIPTQANQEAIIARYPLTLVPQDMRAKHIQWRNRIKHLNSNILMLGYQMVIEETSVPGPGHDRMRLVKDSWCEYPGGYHPTVKGYPSNRDLRIFDPRRVEWQEAFLEACRAMLGSYPYNGLFLDQCTVYEKAHPIPTVKAEMRHALQITLLRLRHEFPNTILIGNSSYNWQGLNGEMNEGRPEQILLEFAPFDGHVQPTMDLYATILKDPTDIERVKQDMALVHSLGAFFSAAVDYQHVLWFDAFDEVIAKYK
ncbi:MAG: hypothetical protein KC592_14540, partial [Nitrospira sp.]|nr:hypothetical protein [Nitrospira sp.]